MRDEDGGVRVEKNNHEGTKKGIVRNEEGGEKTARSAKGTTTEKEERGES